MSSRHRLAEVCATRWRELSGLLALPDVRAGLQQGVMLAFAGAVLLLPPVDTRPSRPSLQSAPAAPSVPDYGDTEPSPAVRTLVDWIAASADHRRLPFAVLDKRNARVYVFDARARLLGTTMVLLGSAIGDDTPPEVIDKPLSAVLAHERITPAGRFVSQPGRDDAGNDVVWVDYRAAVAMHRVQVIDPKERRFERIATPYTHDKRISNGCINVPIEFFDTTLKPALGASRAVVYILPDVKPMEQVFAAAYGPSARRAPAPSAAPPVAGSANL